MSNPQISFVVPCFNYGRYLPDCLDSILTQDGSYNFEIIAIDDGSTDNTREVLDGFSDPRLRVINHQTNQGHIKSVTEGSLLARGEYIARIDPDDRYRRNFLNVVMPKFAHFPEVGAVYGDAAIIDGRGKVTLGRCDSVHGGRDFKGNELVRLMEKNFICAPTLLARREAWLATFPIPEHLAFNDWYLTLIMARRWEFYYVNEVLADYRVHDSNHHHKIVVNKSEEGSILWLLDRICNEVENDADLERHKQQARRHIYGAQYLDMASKYFGCGFGADARRCYLRALLLEPSLFLKRGVARRFVATLLPRPLYEGAKRQFKPLLTRSLR